MRPDQAEDKRYQAADHCKIELEEKLMFEMLDNFKRKTKKFPNQISILDIGCGSGRITREIQKLGYIVRGLDFSREAIAKAKANGIDADLCNFDEGVNQPDNSFDIVWAGDIVEHVFDPIGLLREISRVLKNGGLLLTSIPSDVGFNTILRTIAGISYQEQMYRRSGFYKHHTFFTLHLMDFMLRQANLRRNKTTKALILPGIARIIVPTFTPYAFYNAVIFSAYKVK